MAFLPSKDRLAHIVFEHDDKASKNFDILILILILMSVTVVILDSDPNLNARYHSEFLILEWGFTIVFTMEYLLRIWLSNRKLGYVLSFYGIVDLLAIAPTFLSLLIFNTQYLVVIRGLRLLRVVRILKLGRYMQDADLIKNALINSRTKIQLFLFSVLTVVLIAATLMFIVEGPEQGFTSIPMAMYWAIVTLTTVGYGDIVPVTGFGKMLSAIIMLLGYAIIAVPTGIVTSELTVARNRSKAANTLLCPRCQAGNHDEDAVYCKYCGEKMRG